MGIMLILYGAIKISGYFTRDAFCLAFQFDLAFGILLMAVGVILIARKISQWILFFPCSES